jgi:hypothetical protein
MGSKEDIRRLSMDVSADNRCHALKQIMDVKLKLRAGKTYRKNSKTAPFFGFAGTKGDGWYWECVKAHSMRIYMDNNVYQYTVPACTG